MAKMKKVICFLAYDGMELLDLAGSQTAFHEANQIQEDSYELVIIGFDTCTIICESGVLLTPSIAIRDVKECHTLVIPGGKGARRQDIAPEYIAQLSALMSSCTRVVSICTGAYLAANAGLPDNTTVATHWAFVDDLSKQYPSLNIDREKIYVQDEKYWFSAGVTSGIDLTLKLIELDIGKSNSHQVAKHLVVYLKRAGNQKQYSDVLDMQAPRTPRMYQINQWIKNNINADISVAKLANVVHLSERQCHRMLLQETGNTPAQYIEKYRMQVASELLVTTDKDIKVIASTVGYQTDNGFNRAFERNFSVTPTEYRKAFYSKI